MHMDMDMHMHMNMCMYMSVYSHFLLQEAVGKRGML